MRLSRAEFESKVLDFMVVVHDCYTNTNFANDRSIYAQDLAEAMGWIVHLRGNADVKKVANKC